MDSSMFFFSTWLYLLEQSCVLDCSPSGHAAKQQWNLLKVSFAVFYEPVDR
jgi:hypothetical protein